jgi:hypothetical protein
VFFSATRTVDGNIHRTVLTCTGLKPAVTRRSLSGCVHL